MLENGELLVDDGADIHSCFNVFSLPDDWIGYMTFSKMVPESVVGGDPNKMVYVGIRSAPMGYRFTMDIVQYALRHIVFGDSEVDKASEVVNYGKFPTGPNYSFNCIDGFDWLRKLRYRLDKLDGLKPSEELRRFEESC